MSRLKKDAQMDRGQTAPAPNTLGTALEIQRAALNPPSVSHAVLRGVVLLIALNALLAWSTRST